MIDQETIERIKAGARIEDVVGAYLPLRRSGSELTCLCPFHEDHRIGNFKVSPIRNRFHCYACGATGNAVDFVMKMEGLGFAEALEWLARRQGISLETASKGAAGKAAGTQAIGAGARRELTAWRDERPTLFLPEKMVEARANRDNAFCQWLRALPWPEEQAARVEDVLAMYRIGTSRWGHVIFWQIDENGGIRTGKMMHYRTDGHRDKDRKHAVDWVHSALERKEKRQQEYRCQPTLFGIHLTAQYAEAEVHIVESEKTAVVCAVFYGHPEQHLWLATGGKNELTAERLQPLLDARRRITLHPDRDAIADWQATASEIAREAAKKGRTVRLRVDTELMAAHWQPEDGEKADLADIIERRIYVL